MSLGLIGRVIALRGRWSPAQIEREKSGQTWRGVRVAVDDLQRRSARAGAQDEPSTRKTSECRVNIDSS